MLKIDGAELSGAKSITEFCPKGVPPKIELLAFQLASPEQTKSGLILSIE